MSQQPPTAPSTAPSNRAEVNASFQADDTTEVRGVVRIAPAVLIKLIETTVKGIPGVVDLKQRRRHKSDEDKSRPGKSFDDGTVRVTVDGDQITTDMAISVARGTNIARLTREIQGEVGESAGRMLGMTVRSVNIFVEDIVDPAP